MKAKESVGSLRTGAEDLETKDMEKTEILSAFLALGPIMFSVFLNGLGCTLSELVDDTRLGANSWYTGGHSCYSEGPSQAVVCFML